jgi:uncharacterized protein YdhG (YjbR/CyaY superfamily)
VDKTQFKSVAEYIGSQPENARGILEQVRNAIRKSVPDAEESISYNMPAYKLPRGPVLYFAGWRRHYSLYPVTGRVKEAFKDDLAPYEVSKGTVRFPFAQPVPVKLIEKIAKLRSREVAETAQARKQSKAKPRPR